MRYYLHISFIVLSILGFSLTSVHAETKTATFDSIYVHVATTLAATNIQKAIFVADSLLESSVGSMQKMKSLMLLATLQGRAGEVSDALALALAAESIAQENQFHRWQVRIAGFLSTTFRGANLSSEGEKYLDLAEKLNRKTKDDSPQFYFVQAFIHQERAYYQIDRGIYDTAIKELIKADLQISETPAAFRNPVFKATSLQLLGLCNLRIGNLEVAKEKFSLALEELGEEESGLKGFIYSGLGDVEMQYKNYTLALHFFKKAESYIETADDFNLKSTLYESLTNYYLIVNQINEGLKYGSLYREVLKEAARSTKEISNKLIKQLHLEQGNKAKNITVLLAFSIFLVLVVIVLLVFYNRARKTQKKRFDEIVSQLKVAKPLVNKLNRSIEFENNISTSPGSIMTKETEERLLKELDLMEEGTFFLQQNVSLSALAIELNTNPKYLSYIINTYKEKPFNNYINELKIRSIIEKLTSDSQYLEYKISYLAEESGFSSHSKFASVFRNITGLSPSVFISHLKNSLN